MKIALKSFWVFVSFGMLGIFGASFAQAQNIVNDATERAALLAIYTDTDGGNWVQGRRWTINDINNYPATILYGVQVTNGDITGLSLNSNNLSGELSEELGQLSELTTLSLQSNNLTGSVPIQLNQLTKLTYLSLQNNTFTGTLPTLGSLINLTTLDLGNNDFSGVFPSWIGSLSSLTSLNLSSRPGGLSLTGPIPSTISQLGQLVTLVLSYNNFSGTKDIPDSFSQLDNLQNLYLVSCNLSATSIDQGLNGLLNLRYLTLRSNAAFVKADQSMPDVLLNLPALLQLDLGANGFRKLSNGFNALPSLNNLDLSNTNYSDTTRLISIADTLKTCLPLRTLSLSACSISRLPQNFKDIATVETLNLNFNPLIPTACKILGALPVLKILYVQFCNLTDLPSTLDDITTLQELYAGNNQLNPVPEVIKTIPDLKTLQLSNNQITSLPVWFGTDQMPSITKLELNNNQIPLPLPESFSGFTNLVTLNLSNNDLTGTIPQYFSTFVVLQTLDLSFNEISSIPDFSSCTVLHNVYLQHNYLYGIVPAFLSNTTSVKSNINISFNAYDSVATSVSFTGAPVNVTIGSNKFTFIDVLKLKPSSGGFTYTPQVDSVDLAKDVKAFLNGVVTLIATVDTETTPACHFQWFKYVNGVNDQPLNSPSASAKNFTTTITAGDQGSRYYYKITNPSAAPALSLVSRFYTLIIICEELPTAADFTTKKYLCAMNFIPAFTYPEGCRTKSYQWNFGDGNSSIDKSPLHAYQAGGSYGVVLKVQYTCGICIRDTVVNKQIVYNPSEQVLRDSLIMVTTDIKSQVIASSVTTFSDAWPLEFKSPIATQDGFSIGTEGVWRNDGTYVYNIPRNSSENVNTSTDGSYNLEAFQWPFADINAIPHWTKTNTVTEYSPFSYELENKDVLGVYTAAIYDYGGHLPSANGVNMRNAEMAFTGFEVVDNACSGNWIFGSAALPAFYAYDVLTGLKNMAVVKASLSQLENVSKVDVSSTGFFLNTHLGFNRSNYIRDNEIVCMQVYPQNPAWSIIVLRKSPFPGVWKGRIKVANPVTPIVSPDIENSFAHTGKNSLKITSEKVFKQNLLQLDSGKSYQINLWASVNNPNANAPLLGSNVGVDVIFRNSSGTSVATYSFQPGGQLIEGWQQIKGTFLCPDHRTTIELKFKPGSSTAWFDDLRLHPEKGNMRSYVYDLKDYRLRAILDEENYASLFFYDQEGNLHLTKKETENGIKTISENTSYLIERSND